jgi:HEAT repeat protein
MRNVKMLIAGSFTVAVATMSGTEARSDTQFVGQGVSALGDNRSADQVEFLSTPQHILDATTSGAPSVIWEALEHGEKVECLECIPAVSGLLYYTQDQRVREISAWWLRRRIFGVFGPGEVYEQTVNTLASDTNAQRRMYAAYALGEFLDSGGIQPLSDAITKDSSPQVRSAAAFALGRMNSLGNGGALSTAIKDSDESVRLAALHSAAIVNNFTDEATVSGRLGDSSGNVRRLATEVLENIGAKDTVASVTMLAQTDPSADVRAAACHALGTFKDSSAKGALQGIATNDSNTLVRDAATIALKSL